MAPNKSILLSFYNVFYGFRKIIKIETDFVMAVVKNESKKRTKNYCVAMTN